MSGAGFCGRSGIIVELSKPGRVLFVKSRQQGKSFFWKLKPRGKVLEHTLFFLKSGFSKQWSSNIAKEADNVTYRNG